MRRARLADSFRCERRDPAHLRIPESAGRHRAIEGIDCACNILTFVRELDERARDDGCWSWDNIINAPDIGRLLLLAVLTGADCASVVGDLLGAAFGTGTGAAGGFVVGSWLGGMMWDFAAMAGQNALTQDTPLPVEQCQACLRAADAFGLPHHLPPLLMCRGVIAMGEPIKDVLPGAQPRPVEE